MHAALVEAVIKALLALLRAPVAITRISPLALRPGDSIVLTVNKPRLTTQEVANLRELTRRVWPGHPCVILDSGVTLSVIRTPERPTTSVEPPPLSADQAHELRAQLQAHAHRVNGHLGE